MKRFSIAEVILMIIIGSLMTVLAQKTLAMIQGITPVNGLLIFATTVLFGFTSVIVYLLFSKGKDNDGLV